LKLGTENKKETIIAAVLVAFAAWFGIRQFTSGPTAGAATPATTSSTEPVEPGVAQRTTVTPRSQQQQRKNATIALPSGVPGLRLDLLKLSQQIAYAGTGRNIFRDEPERLPTPKTPVIKGPAPPPPNPGPPLPPPINLKFFGFARRAGQQKQIFLADGDDTFIAKEGDIVDRRYKVVKIYNDSVDIEDLLNNNTQRIPLSQ
jgi:hypothetical protein